MKKRITAFIMATLVSLTPFTSYAAGLDGMDAEPVPQENQQETEVPENEPSVTEPEEVKSVDEQLNNEDKEVSETKQEAEVPAEEIETPTKTEAEEAIETSEDKGTDEDEEVTYTVSFYDSIDEKVFATATVSENGSVEELPEAPEHEGYEFKEYEGTYTDVIADETVTAVYEATDAADTEDILVYAELSETVGDYAISAVGNMPEGTKLVASMIENDSDVEKTVCDSVEGMTFKAQVSFDIKLMDGDKEYQPVESDETVKISINHINSDSDLAVFRITDDGAVTNMNASVSGETVDFVTDHFTTYTVGEASYESKYDGKWLGFDYSLYDTDGDGVNDTCVLTGEQTEANKPNSSTYFRIGLKHVVVKNAKINYGERLFAGHGWANTITFENVDTSSVTNMNSMFENCSASTLDLSCFDTSNVTNMSDMFKKCSAKTLDLSSFKTSNVTNMNGMFNGCYCVKNLDLSSFDTSNVTDMSEMFHMQSVETLNLSSFNTSNVTNMSSMFTGTQTLQNLDLSNFDTSNVADMSNMFNYCYVKNLDLSSFDTSNVTDMNKMFYRTRYLKNLDLSSFNTSKVTNMNSMFDESALANLDLSNFDTSEVTNMESMFSESNLQDLNLSNFNTSKVTNMESMFSSCTSLKNLDLSNFDTSNVTSMSWMFARCKSLTNFDLSSFNTLKVTDMSGMFREINLKNLDLSNFNTSNVTNMSSMFDNCTYLENLDLSNFNTSNVTNMYRMFCGSQSLRSVNLSSFDTSKVTNMSQMFAALYFLETLDLSNFDTSNVTNMYDMFGYSHITTLNLSNMDLQNLTDYSRMFDHFIVDILYTPINVNADISIIMGDPESSSTSNRLYTMNKEECLTLPKGLSESVELHRGCDVKAYYGFYDAEKNYAFTMFALYGENIEAEFNEYLNKIEKDNKNVIYSPMVDSNISSLQCIKSSVHVFLRPYTITARLQLPYTYKDGHKIGFSRLVETCEGDFYNRYYDSTMEYAEVAIENNYNICSKLLKYAKYDLTNDNENILDLLEITPKSFNNEFTYQYKSATDYTGSKNIISIKDNYIICQFGYERYNDFSNKTYIANLSNLNWDSIEKTNQFSYNIYASVDWKEAATITYIDANGNTITTEVQEVGSKIELPEEYAKSLKDIKYYDPNGNEITTVPNKDTTVTVKASVAVTYVDSNNNTIATIDQKIGSKIGLPEEYTKNRKDIKYTDADGNEIATVPNKDTTVHVGWIEIATITYKDSEGNVIATIEQETGSKIGLPEEYTKDLKDVKYYDADGNEVTTVPDKDTTITVKSNVTVTYIDLNDKTIAVVNQESGSKIELPEQYARKFNDIKYYDTNGKEITTVPSKDVTVTVRFEHAATAYICLPNKIDGKWVFSDKDAKNTNLRADSDNTKDSSYSNYVYYKNDASVSDEICTKYYSYAEDDLNKYITVSGRDLPSDYYEKNSGSTIFVDGNDIYYTDLYTGEKFVGNLSSVNWFVAKEYGDQLWRINGSLEWKKIKNSITYVDDEGNTIATVVQDVDSEIGLPEEYTKNHKDIKYTDADGNEITTVPDTDNVVIHVEWTEIATVTYVDANGNKIAELVQETGSKIGLPEKYTKNHKDIKYTDADGNEIKTVPNKDITVHVAWTEIKDDNTTNNPGNADDNKNENNNNTNGDNNSNNNNNSNDDNKNNANNNTAPGNDANTSSDNNSSETSDNVSENVDVTGNIIGEIAISQTNDGSAAGQIASGTDTSDSDRAAISGDRNYKTGDYSNIALNLVIIGMAIGAIATICTQNKKKKY